LGSEVGGEELFVERLGGVGAHVAEVVGGEGVVWEPACCLVASTPKMTPFHDARSATHPAPAPVACEYNRGGKMVKPEHDGRGEPVASQLVG